MSSRAYILLALLSGVAAAPSSAQNAGTCNFSESCPWRCCRGAPGDPRCFCSRCCLALGHELGPDDRAQKIAKGARSAAVYRHRVEFFRGKDPKPLRVLRFEEGICPLDPRAGSDGVVLICTSAEWGVAASSGAERGFCGGLGFDGKEVFRLLEPEAEGVAREPLGTGRNGREALFALTKARKDEDREIIGYRLWVKGRPAELLPADGPRVRKLLEKYEGPLVLPGPQQGN